MANVNSEVCQLKFDREVGRLNDQRLALQQRGIFIVGIPAFPIVELLFVPRHLAQLAVTIPTKDADVDKLSSSTTEQNAMAFAAIPNLAARAFKARFDLSDYDLRAPSIEFWDPWVNEPLKFASMFRALEYEKDRQVHVVLLNDHPITHKPFLCLRGVREYHEHPQHSGDEWLLYRNHMNLFSIVMSLWRVSLDLVHPIIIPNKSGFQVQWTAERKP